MPLEKLPQALVELVLQLQEHCSLTWGDLGTQTSPDVNPPKSNIDSKNDGFLICLSFQIWLFWVSSRLFSGVYEVVTLPETNGQAPPVK